jgi:hypothetical protein
VPSKVDRIRGINLIDPADRCDFDSIDSINEHFPCYKGKGKQDIPLAMLHLYGTAPSGEGEESLRVAHAC